MSKLKPCPFCGGEALLTQIRPSAFDPGKLYKVGCGDPSCVGAHLNLISTKELATEKWNHRAADNNPKQAFCNELAILANRYPIIPFGHIIYNLVNYVRWGLVKEITKLTDDELMEIIRDQLR